MDVDTPMMDVDETPRPALRPTLSEGLLDVSQRDESVSTEAPEEAALDGDDEVDGMDVEDEGAEPTAEPEADEVADEAKDEPPPPPQPEPPAEKVKLSFGSGLNIDLSAITTLKAAKPSSRKSDPKPEDVPKPRREEAKKVDPKTTIPNIKTFDTTNLPFTGSLGESGMYTGSVSGQYKPHGKGTMVYDNGHVIRGYWVEGDLVRESEMYSDSDDDEDDEDDDGEEDLVSLSSKILSQCGGRNRDSDHSRYSKPITLPRRWDPWPTSPLGPVRGAATPGGAGRGTASPPRRLRLRSPRRRARPRPSSRSATTGRGRT